MDYHLWTARASRRHGPDVVGRRHTRNYTFPMVTSNPSRHGLNKQNVSIIHFWTEQSVCLVVMNLNMFTRFQVSIYQCIPFQSVVQNLLLFVFLICTRVHLWELWCKLTTRLLILEIVLLKCTSRSRGGVGGPNDPFTAADLYFVYHKCFARH